MNHWISFNPLQSRIQTMHHQCLNKCTNRPQNYSKLRSITLDTIRHPRLKHVPQRTMLCTAHDCGQCMQQSDRQPTPANPSHNSLLQPPANPHHSHQPTISLIYHSHQPSLPLSARRYCCSLKLFHIYSNFAPQFVSLVSHLQPACKFHSDLKALDEEGQANCQGTNSHSTNVRMMSVGRLSHGCCRSS